MGTIEKAVKIDRLERGHRLGGGGGGEAILLMVILFRPSRSQGDKLSVR